MRHCSLRCSPRATIVAALAAWLCAAASASAQGSLVKAAAIEQSVSVPNGWNDLTFSATLFDSGGFWNASAGGRLTAPAGVGYVRVAAWIDLPSSCTVCGIYIVKNGGIILGSYGATANTGFGHAGFTAVAPIVKLTAGDYFTLRVYQNTGSTLTAAARFSMTALDTTATSAGASLKAAGINQATSVPDGSGVNLSFSTPSFDTGGLTQKRRASVDATEWHSSVPSRRRDADEASPRWEVFHAVVADRQSLLAPSLARFRALHPNPQAPATLTCWAPMLN